MLQYICLIVVVTSLTDAAVSPVSLDLPIVNKNRTALPEVLSNNVTSGRSLFGPLPQPLQALREYTLPFVVRELGMIECKGIDHVTGGNFFETIMGPGADFSGDYLCEPTCGGQCKVTQGLGEAPISIYYPFGCKCPAQRCNENGPVIAPLIRTFFEVVCVPDERCTCASMDEPIGSMNGYLCNWINRNTSYPVSFLSPPVHPHYPPSYSPIRWCSCCPRSLFG